MKTERSLPNRLREWARAHPRLLGASVIVTALALTGVAVVTAATLFSGMPVGQADPTPSPSASASPAPSASASAEPSVSVAPSGSAAPTAIPGPEWPPVGDPTVEALLPPMWTVAVVNDLNIRSGPGTEHPAIGQMDAGDVAKVVDVVDGEWVWVAADGAIGYVNAGPRGDPYLLATKTPWTSSFKGLSGVATDGEAYLAYGSQLAVDYPPYELHGIPSLSLRSEDGITWTALEDGPPWSISSVAASDAGWVAVMQVPFGGSAVAFSADGESWVDPGPVGEGLSVVAHGPAGFVGLGMDGAWTSADGRSWDGPHPTAAGEPPPGSASGIPGDAEIESSEVGYIAFQRFAEPLWATVDGVTWTRVDHGGVVVSDAELVENRLHVVLVDAEGATTVRRGTLSASGSVTWAGPAAAIEARRLHVDRITQSPDGLLAVGWDESDLVPVLWASADGTSWERMAGTDGLDGVAEFEPEWGPAGWVGPELLRSADGAAWHAPQYSLAYDGPLPPCPPAEEVSTIVLSYLGTYAERCLGDASVTIRGETGGARLFGSDCCTPIPEPAWLATPFGQAVIASGPRSDGLGVWHLALFVPPDVDNSLSEEGTWVEVVGHYRDPASETCRQRPNPVHASGLIAAEIARAQCRERFVVESVIEVEGP